MYRGRKALSAASTDKVSLYVFSKTASSLLQTASTENDFIVLFPRVLLSPFVVRITRLPDGLRLPYSKQKALIRKVTGFRTRALNIHAAGWLAG
jgi:hypothetical protein